MNSMKEMKEMKEMEGDGSRWRKKRKRNRERINSKSTEKKLFLIHHAATRGKERKKVLWGMTLSEARP